VHLGPGFLELDAVRAIERYISTTIPRQKLEGFPYLYTALFNESAIPPGGSAKGRRLPED
jgi:hypothetical protein